MCFNCFGGGTGEVSRKPPNLPIKPPTQDPVRTYPRHNGSPRKSQDQPVIDANGNKTSTTTVREDVVNDESSYSKQSQQQQQLHRNRESINDASLSYTDAPNSKSETSKVSPEELTASREQETPFPNNEKSNKNAQAPKASPKVELIPSRDPEQLTTLEGRGVATAHQNVKAETSKLPPKERTRDSS